MNKLTPLWGCFGPNGKWHPNPRLQMSEEEQRRQNAITLARQAQDGQTTPADRHGFEPWEYTERS